MNIKTSIIVLSCTAWLTLTSETCIDNSNCKESVTVLDMTHLDGCGMMLVTEDKKKLFPVNLDDFAIEIKDGDTLMVSYAIAKNAMSICMAEDLTVKLSCLVITSPSPAKVNCPEMTDPVKFSWSKQVLKEMDLRSIEHIKTAEEDYYWFRSVGDCRLYSCTGQVICIGTCNENDKCEAYFADNNITVNESRVIYVQDN